MTVEIGTLEKYKVEDMRVFQVDDSEWIAAPTLLHALVEYDSQINLEVDDLQDIVECDIEKEGVWDSDCVTKQEELDVMNGKITLLPHNEVCFGQFGFFCGEVCKFVPFKEVIKRQGVGVYIIACTEG
ncbi:hypothetical protein [Enterococcus durans]|uniref:hypothetical protein n=1 Tax=Enterococcus durans TaxID=53345 RepID=UPI00232C0D71|nr:hypothetical protein [Enterococcus durans]WCG26705.1 hypothetical protein PML98_08910 [Enterococcus durans]WCG68268.1 hypothetical protein PML92_08920 [Enterococcus durans]